MKTKSENITFFSLLDHRQPLGSKEETVQEVVQLLDTTYKARKELEKTLLTSRPFYKLLLSWSDLLVKKELTIKELLFRGKRTQDELKAKLGLFLLNLKLFKSYLAKQTEVLKQDLYKHLVMFDFNTNRINSFKEAILTKRVRCSKDMFEKVSRLQEVMDRVSCRLVELYAPFAVDQAIKRGVFYKEDGSIDMDYKDDLIQAGLMGIYIAAQHWDPTKNASFTTYSWYWISSEFTKFYTQKDVVDLPRNVINLKNKINKLSVKFGISKTNPSDFKQYVTQSVKRIDNAMQQGGVVSINDLIADEYEAEEKGLEFLTDGQDVVYDTQKITDSETVQKILSKYLNKKERKIMDMRFGLNGQDQHSFIEIADEFGWTGENARIYVNKCLQKIIPEIVRIFGEDYDQTNTNKVLALHRKKK